MVGGEALAGDEAGPALPEFLDQFMDGRNRDLGHHPDVVVVQSEMQNACDLRRREGAEDFPALQDVGLEIVRHQADFGAGPKNPAQQWPELLRHAPEHDSLGGARRGLERAQTLQQVIVEDETGEVSLDLVQGLFPAFPVPGTTCGCAPLPGRPRGRGRRSGRTWRPAPFQASS